MTWHNSVFLAVCARHIWTWENIQAPCNSIFWIYDSGHNPAPYVVPKAAGARAQHSFLGPPPVISQAQIQRTHWGGSCCPLSGAGYSAGLPPLCISALVSPLHNVGFPCKLWLGCLVWTLNSLKDVLPVETLGWVNVRFLFPVSYWKLTSRWINMGWSNVCKTLLWNEANGFGGYIWFYNTRYSSLHTCRDGVDNSVGLMKVCAGINANCKARWLRNQALILS